MTKLDEIEARAEQTRAAHEMAKDRGARYAASFWWYIWHNQRTLAGQIRHAGRRALAIANIFDRMDDSELKRSVLSRIQKGPDLEEELGDH